MAIEKKSGLSILATITLAVFFSCGDTQGSESISHVENKGETKPVMVLDTFSAFPPEIDGCSCYFSRDTADFNKGKYIYVNDYALTCFVKINGILTKLSQTNFIQTDSLNVKAMYTSDTYDMTIEVKNLRQSGDEASLKTGTITLTDKNGNTSTAAFYGECGC